MMDPHHDTGADNLRGKSVEEQLEKILREAEASLSELRSELAEQRRRKELSLEIERLPEHLENTTVQWSVVRDFFSELIGELRETREDELGTSEAGETEIGRAVQQECRDRRAAAKITAPICTAAICTAPINTASSTMTTVTTTT